MYAFERRPKKTFAGMFQLVLGSETTFFSISTYSYTRKQTENQQWLKMKVKSWLNKYMFHKFDFLCYTIVLQTNIFL